MIPCNFCLFLLRDTKQQKTPAVFEQIKYVAYTAYVEGTQYCSFSTFTQIII